MNGTFEIGDGAVRITPQTLQARQAAVGIQVLLQLDHALIGVRCGLILSDLQVRIAQDTIGMAIGGIEPHRLLRLHGGLIKAMAHVHRVGQMPCRPAVLRGDLQASLQGLLGQIDIGDIAGLSSFLQVGIAQSIVDCGITGIALQQALIAHNSLIRCRRLCPRQVWRHAQRQ